MTRQEATPGPERVSCEICGDPHATAITLHNRDWLLCSACLQNEVVWSASTQHLKDMVREVFEAWLDAWADNPTYRHQWSQLHSALSEPFDLPVLAAEVLTARGIVPRREKASRRER